MTNPRQGCIALAVSVLSWPWQAFVTMMAWGWFAVPFGLPALTFWWAFGIDLLVAQIVSQPYPPEDDDGQKVLTRTIARGWLFPAVILLLGWIVQGRM